MNFTDSPFEQMMKQKPYVSHRDRYTDGPERGRQGDTRKHGGKRGGNRRGRASGQVDPKLAT